MLLIIYIISILDSIILSEALSSSWSTTSVKTIDVGKDMQLSILMPPDESNRQLSMEHRAGTTITTSDGRGDVIWPSSLALAKLISHCPFLVKDKAILELGCGLGLPSLTALLFSDPAHVALSDKDNCVLSLAYMSSTQLNRGRASVSRSTMDWSDITTWPKQKYDLLIGADILYEKSSILSLIDVLKFYLEDIDLNKRALLVDPVSRPNRDAFSYAAFKAGLDVEEEIFPGKEDFVLLSITWTG